MMGKNMKKNICIKKKRADDGMVETGVQRPDGISRKQHMTFHDQKLSTSPSSCLIMCKCPKKKEAGITWVN